LLYHCRVCIFIFFFRGEKKKKSKKEKAPVDETPPVASVNVEPERPARVEVPKLANPVVAEQKLPTESTEKQAKKKSSKSKKGPEVQEPPPQAGDNDETKACHPLSSYQNEC
jgi:hypothetical protein